MDGEELRGLYSTGWRDFSGLDLRGANISGIDLSTDDPDYRIAANLSGIDLSEADLSGAILSGANLTEANLSGADLSGANLTEANLTNTNLSGANLTEACLSAAKLSNTNMRGANLLFTDMTQCGALMGEWVTDAQNISKVNFEGTAVYNLTLEDGTFIEFSDHDW